MADPRGFLKVRQRETQPRRPVPVRIMDWKEVYEAQEKGTLKAQAGRCMDCGIPFCHQGCPLGNLIPEWNDLMWRDKGEEAIERLHATNNFPEFTGRLCPAPCEASCVLGINQPAVTIKQVEVSIIDEAWDNGWVNPLPPARLTGKTVAVVGSGPAGLAVAQQLTRVGHTVAVYERDDKIGGLLRYGIPDFKMEKDVIARRVKQMEAEGVTFHCGIHVGQDLSAKYLESKHDAVLIAIGSEQPFDFFAKSPGRDLDGLHYAMDFLPQQNRRNAGEPQKPKSKEISAKDKHVIVIGGGDTGSDCIGTSFRQGAKSVTQLEIMPMPPEKENKALSWPHWPLKLRISTSQAEGAKTEYSISTTGFSGEGGKVKKLHYTRVNSNLQPVKGTEGALDADLVLFAMGFSGPVETDIVKEFGLPVVPRGRFKGLDATDRDYKLSTSPKLFCAGDIRRGQSLVVWAIREGRQAAHAIDKFLMGSTVLPR